MKIPMSRHQLALSLTAAPSPCKEIIQHSHVTPFLPDLKVRVRKGIRAQFRKDFQNLGSISKHQVSLRKKKQVALGWAKLPKLRLSTFSLEHCL